MKDFPSCFGENGVQVAGASVPAGSRVSQNSVTCLYRCKASGFIRITWTKNLIGRCLCVEIDDARVYVNPSPFSKRRGSKSLGVNAGQIEVFWDLSLAKFGPGPGPEPSSESYYISVVFDGETILSVGDLKGAGAVVAPSLSSTAKLISKKEHIFGKRVYGTRTQFSSDGRAHDVRIECDLSSSHDPFLVVRVDSKPVMQVKHLHWKFRGSYTIFVDGLPVEVFWDVHDWLFGLGSGRGAVFLFRSGGEKAWPGGQSEVLSWSFSDRNNSLGGVGFSLFLYAWRNE